MVGETEIKSESTEIKKETVIEKPKKSNDFFWRFEMTQEQQSRI